MVRMRQFDPEKNVLEAARERVDVVLDGCDRIAVAYSGGKDSLALLHLVRERQLHRGDERPVAAVFRDMEYVNGSVIDKVAETFALPWVDGRWLCLEAHSRTNIAGSPLDYTAWDPARRRHRPLPKDAITDPGRQYDEPAFDRVTVAQWPGKVVIATGLRACESLIRYRAIANKLSEPWLAKSKAPGISMARPIYDFLENDVLRYLLDCGAVPAAIYDAQAWHGKGDLRTASLVATEQMRDLPTLKATDPDAYASLLDLAPEVAVAERYDRDLKDRHNVGRRAESMLEVRKWALEKYADHPRALERALARLAFARGLARKNPGGFPPWWVQHEIARDGHGTGMMPLPVDHPSRKATS